MSQILVVSEKPVQVATLLQAFKEAKLVVPASLKVSQRLLLAQIPDVDYSEPTANQ